VPNAELELIRDRVTNEGGELRILQGSGYGLATSVMYSRVAPGSGPRRHRHPHTEIFVLHAGRGRYEVEGSHVDAQAGDMVVIPPDAWHSFQNTGTDFLSHTAIHENARAISDFEDGTHRE
jgi:quercetin dioxygenase-like cupin family protein